MSGEAFAQDPICKDATVSVAPGGSVKVPVDCYNTPPFTDPKDYYVKKALTTVSTSKGSLFEGKNKLSLASPSIAKGTTELLYRADLAAMGLDTFQFFGHTYDVKTNTPTPPGMWISKPNSVGTIQIDPTGINAPKCNDVSVTVKAGETIDIPTDCIGPMGVPLTLNTASNPAHGKLGTPDSVRKLIPYTADRTYSGKDTFTYYASTATQTSNEATVTITVSAHPLPQCRDIAATVKAGETVDIPTDCTDPAGKPLKLAVVTKPTNGTVGVPNDAKAVIPYTANAAYAGSDKFTYNASNGTDTSNEAAVTLTVTRKADPPPTTTTTTTTTPPPPPENPAAPSCKDVTKKIFIPFGEYDKDGKLIGEDPSDKKIPHPVTLDCTGMSGAKLTYELLDTKKFGSLQGFDPATGKVNWHNVDWDALEKEACSGTGKETRCDDSKFPPFKNHPEEVPEDPDTHLPAGGVFAYGWDEQYRYRAIDETHNLTSNVATLTVQERDGMVCRWYRVGRVLGIPGDNGEINLYRCLNKEGKWETAEDPKHPSPFTGEDRPTSCVKLESGGRSPRTQSRWVRFTSKSSVKLKTQGTFSRSSTRKVTFNTLVKGKKQVFPKPPKFIPESETKKTPKPFMNLAVLIDDYDIGGYSRKKVNRLPSTAQFDPSTLKPGRHTFSVVAERVTPKKNGQWKTKVLKKVSLTFTVVNCEPARLTANKSKSGVTLQATSGNVALKGATFSLPKKLGTRSVGTASKLKLSNKLTIKLKRVKKTKKLTVLANKNGVTVKAKGKQIIIMGLPQKVTSLTLTFSKARPTRQPLYRARLQSDSASVAVSTRLQSPGKRSKRNR